MRQRLHDLEDWTRDRLDSEYFDEKAPGLVAKFSVEISYGLVMAVTLVSGLWLLIFLIGQLNLASSVRFFGSSRSAIGAVIAISAPIYQYVFRCNFANGD